MKIAALDPPGVHETRRSRGISQVIKVEGGAGMVFLSGQLPYDKDENVVGLGDPAAQARQVFENLRVNLAAAGATFDDVVKMTGFIVDFAHVGAIRAVRTAYVNPDRPPASTMVLVPHFAKPGVLLEIDAIAVVGR